MKVLGIVAILLLLVLAVANVWGVVRPTPQPSGITAWEYMVVDLPDEDLSKALDKIGRDGWEAASARRAVSKVGAGSETTGIYEIIFKRPRKENYLIQR
jgi:hypothetical protein